MKKLLFLLMSIGVFASCSQDDNLQGVSKDTLAKNVKVTVHDFVSDNISKATVTKDTPFAWADGDKIGVWPLSVAPGQATTQLQYNLSAKTGASATFGTESGWGLICTGEFSYASCFPYNAEATDKTAIPVTFPTYFHVNTNDGIYHVGSSLVMYAPQIAPASSTSATFDFYQLGALAHFEITAPTGVAYAKAIISTSDDSNVFTTEATYDLTTATSSSVTITPVTQVNTIGVTLNNLTLAGEEKLGFYFLMCPAQLGGKTLNVKLFDGDNNKYTGTISCSKDQVSGKTYKYTATVTLQPKSAPVPTAAEGVDLGTGILWAPYNLGASSMEETGDYYAFGETTTRTDFSEANYSYLSLRNAGSALWLEYKTGDSSPTDAEFDTWLKAIDGGTTYPNGILSAGVGTLCIKNGQFYQLKPEYDAVVANWAPTVSGWRMPTYSELLSLLLNTDKERTTINGIEGFKYMNKTDHSKWIFLPVTGYKTSSTVTELNKGYYAAPSFIVESGGSMNKNCLIHHTSDRTKMGGNYRMMGQGYPIRPVRAK